MYSLKAVDLIHGVKIDRASVVCTDRASVVPIDRASVVPIDRTSVVPINRASVVPIDRASVVTIGRASVVPIDRASVVPIDRASVVTIGRALVVSIDRASVVPIDRAAVALRRLAQRVKCWVQPSIGRCFTAHTSRLSRMLMLLCLLTCLVGCAVKDTPTPTAVEPSLTAPEATPTEAPLETPTTARGSSENARQLMVDITIEGRGVVDPDVLRAMRTVPRHEFVPDTYLPQAYADHPLPIGYGQTISQPYIVAWMTELLELKPGEKVLEIGTGSGYQAAVLAELGFVEVYSIEIIPELAESAAALLERLGYDVQVKQGDGYYGWLEHSPFDAVIVTAAPDHLPSPLVAQLVEGGRLVIPIGPPGGYQSLWKFVKSGDDLVAYNMGGVAFVPFTGDGMESGGGSENPIP